MANKDRVADIFAYAEELDTEYRDCLDRRAANRRILRDLANTGMLSEEEAVRVDEIYPRRATSEAEGEGEPLPQAA